jgi:ATP-dependent Clp protease ATP-binding subunit ClpA
MPRATKDARSRVLAIAGEEAQRRGDARIGSEHLLLALLHDPDTLATRALDVDRAAAHAALVELDRMALAAIGIELPHLHADVAVHSRRRPPLTSGARAVLHRAATAATSVRARTVQTRHLLLGVLDCKPPDPAARLLTAVGVDPAAAKRRLTALQP